MDLPLLSTLFARYNEVEIDLKWWAPNLIIQVEELVQF